MFFASCSMKQKTSQTAVATSGGYSMLLESKTSSLRTRSSVNSASRLVGGTFRLVGEVELLREGQQRLLLVVDGLLVVGLQSEEGLVELAEVRLVGEQVADQVVQLLVEAPDLLLVQLDLASAQPSSALTADTATGCPASGSCLGRTARTSRCTPAGLATSTARPSAPPADSADSSPRPPAGRSSP